jgi:hypothetical protein
MTHLEAAINDDATGQLQLQLPSKQPTRRLGPSANQHNVSRQR